MRKARRGKVTNKSHVLKECHTGRGWMGGEFHFPPVLVMISVCLWTDLRRMQWTISYSIVTTCSFADGRSKNLCPRGWFWLWAWAQAPVAGLEQAEEPLSHPAVGGCHSFGSGAHLTPHWFTGMQKTAPSLFGHSFCCCSKLEQPKDYLAAVTSWGRSDLPAKHGSPGSHSSLLSCCQSSCAVLAWHHGWWVWVQPGSCVTCSLSFKADSLNIRLMLSQRCAVGCNSICCDKVTPEKVCAASCMSSLYLLHAQPFYLLVGLAHCVVAWESSKTLSIFSEVLLEFQCCFSFILISAVSAVSPPFVFTALEQQKHLFMALIWQLLEGHWTKDTISGKQECSNTSAQRSVFLIVLQIHHWFWNLIASWLSGSVCRSD